MMSDVTRVRLRFTSDPPNTRQGTESFGQAAVVRREAYAADIDEWRKQYGKAEGERRFFAEHAPISETVTSDQAAIPTGPPSIDPFTPFSIDAGCGW